LVSCDSSREQSRYDRAFQAVVANEGGYVNDPNDPDGETKYGICKRYNPGIDIKNITLSFAKQYYRSNYWGSIFDRVKNQEIAIKLFDVSVNIGYSRMKVIINESLMDSYCYPDKTLVSQLNKVIEADNTKKGNSNDWEDFVVQAINRVNPELFLSVFKAKLVNYYCSIVRKHNRMVVFRQGWISRAVR